MRPSTASSVLRRWPIAAVVVVGLGVAAVATAAPQLDRRSAQPPTNPAVRLTTARDRASADARSSRATTRGTRRSRRRPLHPLSAQIINHIQAVGTDYLHPDFGENLAYGIPYIVVPASQPLVPITYDRVRRRERSRPVPDPAQRSGRGRRDRRRPARAGGAGRHLPALRVVRRSADGRDRVGWPPPAPSSI